ncbi:hypothetical protein JOD21_001821 [Jeotgalibacillus terrae]|nr:hypothetical protein [Jeotgalibacillus terrae]
MGRLIKRAIKYGPIVYPFIRKFLNSRKTKRY